MIRKWFARPSSQVPNVCTPFRFQRAPRLQVGTHLALMLCSLAQSITARSTEEQ